MNRTTRTISQVQAGDRLSHVMPWGDDDDVFTVVSIREEEDRYLGTTYWMTYRYDRLAKHFAGGFGPNNEFVVRG